MKPFRFLHAADLHLDCQLRGLDQYEGAPVETLRQATRVALENLIQLAIDEQVAFVIIAGDLFDGQWTDIQTGLWTAQRFRRLEKQGINVYLIRGNHDAQTEVPHRITWPSNVKEFPTECPGTLFDEATGAALHGQGFATRECPYDIASHYPVAQPGRTNIGLLHTSLTGDLRHDVYAPTSVETLIAKGYDYWALGHIHAMRIVHESPRIAYPGCAQARHVKETGEKGCLLVDVDGRGIRSEFRAIDVLRWHSAVIELPAEARRAEAIDRVREALEACRENSHGRFAAVRLTLTGRCAFHRELRGAQDRSQIVNEIRNVANEWDNVWIEKVELETAPPVDVEALRSGQDLFGELLRDFAHWHDADDTELASLATILEPLAQKIGGALPKSDLDLADAERLRHWLKQAESLVLSLAPGDESA